LGEIANEFADTYSSSDNINTIDYTLYHPDYSITYLGKHSATAHNKYINDTSGEVSTKSTSSTQHKKLQRLLTTGTSGTSTGTTNN